MPVQLELAVDYLRKLAVAGTEGGADAELLRRFVQQRDEAAFAGLVERHGVMVLNVCRRVLHHHQDAEDAFQATFLVLARQAAAIRKSRSLGSWLHAVAYRVASRLSTQRARRRAVETSMPGAVATDPAAELTWREVQAVLDAELQRLPEQYRAPLVLCYLEGKTRDEAAAELGWSLAVLRGRLERGRKRLRCLLRRRGLGISAPLLAAALAESAGAAAPHPLAAMGVVKNALRFMTMEQAGLLPVDVVTLAREVLSMLTASKLKSWLVGAAVLLLVGFLAVGWSFHRGYAVANPAVPSASDESPEPGAPAAAPVKPKVELVQKVDGPLPKAKPDPVADRLRELLPPSVILLTKNDNGKIVQANLGQLMVMCLEYPQEQPGDFVGGHSGGISPGKCAAMLYPGEGARGKEIAELHKKLTNVLAGGHWMVAWFEASLPGMDKVGVTAALKSASWPFNKLEVTLSVANPFQSVEVERFYRSVNVTWKKTEKVEIKDQEKIAALMAHFPELWAGKKSAQAQFGGWGPRFKIQFLGKDAKPVQVSVSANARLYSDGKSDLLAEPNLRYFLAELFGDAAELDLLRMQGDWRLVSHNGKPLADQIEVHQLSIRETAITVTKGSNFPLPFSIKHEQGIHFLDPAKQPKQISLVHQEPTGATVLIPGIYSLDDKQYPLKLCLGKPGAAHPTSFSSANGQAVLLFIHADNDPPKPADKLQPPQGAFLERWPASVALGPNKARGG